MGPFWQMARRDPDMVSSHTGQRRWKSVDRAVSFIRQSGVHGAWIALWSIVGWAGTATAPFLLDSPVLLMMLAPRAAFVLLAAPTVGLFWFVVLGTFRLSVTDASWFLVGRRLPQWSAKQEDRMAQCPRWRVPMRIGRRLMVVLCTSAPLAALILFLRPNGRYLGVAGSFGVDSRLAGVSSVAGTIVYLIAVHLGVGELFS